MEANQFTIESPVFRGGGTIPEEYTAHGRDLSPPLKWHHVPPEAVELVLICEDPDAPGSAPFVHWIVYGLPPNVRELPAGISKKDSYQLEFQMRQGQNSYGETGYRGPKPPMGTGIHHYFFKLYALNRPLGLRSGHTRDEVMDAMEGKVIARAQYMGTHHYH